MARRRKMLKFNKEFYNMLDAEDKKHYMSQDPLMPRLATRITKSIAKQVYGKSQSKKPRQPLPIWQDRDVSNRGTKLNP